MADGAIACGPELVAEAILRRALRVQQHAGIEDPGRVERALGRPQRRGERLRALAVVPGPVVAADRVVVGDRARPRRGSPRTPRALTSSHCSSSIPRRAGRQHREVGRGAVGVGVREAAGDAPVAAAPRARPLAHRAPRTTRRSGPR